MQVLLIDPNVLLADTYRQALTQAGHSVAVAHDAQTAIRHADDAIPDVVILELQLVRHNGIEFLYEFRSYKEWQQIPVIILSATILPDHMIHTLKQQLHVSACHYKPHTKLSDIVKFLEHTHSAAV